MTFKLYSVDRAISLFIRYNVPILIYNISKVVSIGHGKVSLREKALQRGYLNTKNLFAMLWLFSPRTSIE